MDVHKFFSSLKIKSSYCKLSKSKIWRKKEARIFLRLQIRYALFTIWVKIYAALVADD